MVMKRTAADQEATCINLQNSRRPDDGYRPGAAIDDRQLFHVHAPGGAHLAQRSLSAFIGLRTALPPNVRPRVYHTGVCRPTMAVEHVLQPLTRLKLKLGARNRLPKVVTHSGSRMLSSPH